MSESEERKNNNFLTIKKRTKIRKFNNSELSSEFRGIVKDIDENDFIESKKNNEIVDKNDKKENTQGHNDINNSKTNVKSIRRKTKKISMISGTKRNSIFNKEEDLDEEEDDEELTFRQRITKFFETHNRLFYIKITTTIICLLTSVYYVICTYIDKLFITLNYFDFFACTLFLIEHIINILLSHHFIFYIFSIESLIMFLIEIPPFFSMLCSDFHSNGWYRFINVTRVMRLIKGYRIIEIIQGEESSVNTQIFNIIAILISIVFIWAGIIQMFDLSIVDLDLKITFETLARKNLLLRTQFHHYIYFIIVSLTTVGYGEIIPSSILGKVMIVILVIVILVVVPDQTSELINLSNAQTIYERKKYLSTPDISFVVLMGNIELEALKNFCKEFFNISQGNIFKHIVILVNKPPDKATELFLNQNDNSKFIIYLQGDPMNDDDLLRCDILHAKSCVIFTNKNSIDPYSRDHQSLLLAICVKKFYYNVSLENYYYEYKVKDDSFSRQHSIKKINSLLKNNNFRIFLQLNRPESCNYYYSTLQSSYRKNMLNDRLIVIESLKMNLLSKSCMTPGIISLISNLCISRSIDKDFFKNDTEWIREYSEGQQYEIIKIYIEDELLNFSFQKLALEIYTQFQSILIAFEVNYKGGTFIKLNPQGNSTLKEIIDSAFGLSDKDKSNIENFVADEASVSFLGEEKQNYMESEFENTNRINDKINEINKKKIKVSLYFISYGKDIKDEIQKLDSIKGHFWQRSKLREKTGISIYPFIKTTHKKAKKSSKSVKSYKSDILDKTISYHSSESEFEEETNDISKYLVDLGNDGGLILDQEELNNNYYTLNSTEKNYLYTNEIMRQGIKDRSDIKGHIIICGMHHEIIHFILPLRSKYIPEKLLKWIIILAPNLPSEIHDALSKFQKIIFIQGDPLYPDNLFRANITKADIAVILGSTYSGANFNSNEVNDYGEIIGKDGDDPSKGDKTSGNDKKHRKIDEEMLDAKTLFIYKSIKKINSSVQIIIELLKNNNIEFLLTSRELKKVYKHAKISGNSQPNNGLSDDKIINEQNGGEIENLKYEYTSVYGAGEVCLPSLIDKITGQMYHKEYLYSVINLLLTGEKSPQKSADKKLGHLFNNLIGSYLFLVPCEQRDESFSDMFKRLLTKNGMISIALYRKNISENCYYVYTNPKKTTLIRDTDFVFVLASTENLMGLIEKNLFSMVQSLNENDIKRLTVKFETKAIANDSGAQQQPSLQENIQHQIGNINISKIKSKKSSKINLVAKIDKKESSKDNSPITERKNKSRYASVKLGEKDVNIHKGKYAEIDSLQMRLDKAMEKLKDINNKYNNIEKDVNNFVKEGINEEFSVYVNKKYNLHS